MTDSLHDRIRAALDREQSLAEAANPGPWRVGRAGRSGVSLLAEDFPLCRRGELFDEDVPHIAAQDPARTLRRIEADRRVLARHVMCQTDIGPECIHDREDWPCPDLLDLAARYDVADR